MAMYEGIMNVDYIAKFSASHAERSQLVLMSCFNTAQELPPDAHVNSTHGISNHETQRDLKTFTNTD